MKVTNFIPFLAAAATASPSQLNPRCSPARDPEWFRGYLPPVACWQDQDTACRAYIGYSTEIYLDTKHKLAVVYGVSSYCFDTIAEEYARMADGRKIYGWEQKHGKLTRVADDILVISNMSDAAVKSYQSLTYTNGTKPSWA